LYIKSSQEKGKKIKMMGEFRLWQSVKAKFTLIKDTRAMQRAGDARGNCFKCIAPIPNSILVLRNVRMRNAGI